MGVFLVLRLIILSGSRRMTDQEKQADNLIRRLRPFAFRLPLAFTARVG